MAKPVNKKLPLLEIVQGTEKLPLNLLQNFCFNKKCENVYFWVQIIGWDYNAQHPKAIVNDIFNYGKTAEG